MDAFLPGVAGWELAYNNDNLWHFRFRGPTPEALVKGREKIYFAYFWNDLAADKRRSLTTADRNASSRHIRVQAACVPAGPTLPPGRRRRRISPRWQRQS
jgi:hypothetical protein